MLDRDRTCQARGRLPGMCYGPLTYHHLKKASAGGDYTEENGLALCAAHNGWIEDNPTQARSAGFVH